MDIQLFVGGTGIVVLNELIIKLLKNYISERFIPALAILTGIALGVVASLTSSTDLLTGIVGGFMVGMTNLGLYDLHKVTIKGE